MGIEAFCPNGHRINVKSTQAGLKGRCPQCNAKFRIPGGTDRGPPGLPTAHLLEVTPALLPTLPRALPFAAAAQVLQAAPVPEAAPTLHPVLAERPDLAWRIAFPGGEPTDPLPAESMQAWLDAGAAEGSEVVWRSDWPEWRPAREVFPQPR